MNQQVTEIENPDNIDNLEINFMPITEGLGFHQDEKIPGPGIRKKSSLVRKNVDTNLEKSSRPMEPGSVARSELDAFYSSKPKQPHGPEAKEEEENKLTNHPQKINLVRQFLAWVVDCSVVVGLAITTLVLLGVSTGLHYKQLFNLLGIVELLICTVGTFLIFYLLYFTILDTAVSVGKGLFRFRLVRNDGKKVKTWQSFTRALITLLSFMVFGLPLFLDFQGKLSDSRLTDEY